MQILWAMSWLPALLARVKGSQQSNYFAKGRLCFDRERFYKEQALERENVKCSIVKLVSNFSNWFVLNSNPSIYNLEIHLSPPWPTDPQLLPQLTFWVRKVVKTCTSIKSYLTILATGKSYHNLMTSALSYLGLTRRGLLATERPVRWPRCLNRTGDVPFLPPSNLPECFHFWMR